MKKSITKYDPSLRKAFGPDEAEMMETAAEASVFMIDHMTKDLVRRKKIFRRAAKIIKTFYDELISAGFTQEEALRIISSGKILEFTPGITKN